MNIGVIVITFLGVNIDFFFMLLFLLKKYNVVEVLVGYLVGVMLLLVGSYLVGATLGIFLPEWLLGLLGILPIYMAFHDNDDDGGPKWRKQPIVMVLLTYLSVCSGCVLAIFLPILIGKSIRELLLTILTIAVLTVLIIFIIKLLLTTKSIVKLMNRYGEIMMKICYILIGLYVFWDSGLIHHVLSYL
ncbi:cadmium resistance transporter [Weissella bombi]|uniref:Cadmium resistance protein CadD, predicted permease n=1 Tax=Weissella bombi TaxID=1505725 RepID=A0A1C3ZVP1_9LACO|nr:cadmium resistance transporter [Weissella bombi]SCB86270.1 Cadmium resistance protein CadD, predicted permease [Weissella bombi]